MGYTESIRNFFVAITIIIIGAISIIKIGTVDLHAILATGSVLVPAVV